MEMGKKKGEEKRKIVSEKNVLEKKRIGEKKEEKKKTYFGLQHFIAAHALQVPQIFWSVERILVSNTTVPLMSRTTAVGT